ncbi:MAG: hypothetical protein RLZZ77_459, partial [Bacteroidota bacterium]
MTSIIVILIIAGLVALLGFEKGWNNLISASRNSLVFENKNKDYGAFQIRKAYGRSLALALAITVVGATAIAVSPLIFGKAAAMAEEVPVEVNVEMLAPPPTDPNEPPPP